MSAARDTLSGLIPHRCIRAAGRLIERVVADRYAVAAGRVVIECQVADADVPRTRTTVIERAVTEGGIGTAGRV